MDPALAFALGWFWGIVWGGGIMYLGLRRACIYYKMLANLAGKDSKDIPYSWPRI